MDAGGVAGLEQAQRQFQRLRVEERRRARPDAGWLPTESRTAISTMAGGASGVADQSRHDGLRVGDDGEVGALDHLGVKIGVDGNDVLYLRDALQVLGAPAIPSAK